MTKSTGLEDARLIASEQEVKDRKRAIEVAMTRPIQEQAQPLQGLAEWLHVMSGETMFDDRKRQLRRWADAVEANGQWQPIETAPKDGQRVMLTCAGYIGPRGMFAHPDSDQEIVHLARYTGEFWEPYIPNDWTHWMSLPLPPGSAVEASLPAGEEGAAPGDAQHVEGFLCRAWGETDLPEARLVHSRAEWEAFVVEAQWGADTNYADLEADDKEAVDGQVRYIVEDMADNGAGCIEFEIGGVSVERVTFLSAAPASLQSALAAPGCERLRDFYETGPVQRAAVEAFLGAIGAAGVNSIEKGRTE